MTWWIILIALWVLAIAIWVWVLKGRDIRRFANQKQTERIQQDCRSITVVRNDAKVENSFTQQIDSTFSSSKWMVDVMHAKAIFRAGNPFGNIFGIRMDCSLLKDGEPIHQFNSVISSANANNSVTFTERFGDVLGALESYKIAFVGRGKHDYRVVFDRVEFQIPETNPLYNDSNVRDVVGMPHVEKEATNLEKYDELCEALPQNLKSYTSEITANIEKARSIAKDDDDAQEHLDSFIDRYIPLINSVLKHYLQQSDDKRNDDEVIDTLKTLLTGTEGLIDKVQARDELDADVAKSVIESQLMRDGLVNPFTESQNKSAH